MTPMHNDEHQFMAATAELVRLGSDIIRKGGCQDAIAQDMAEFVGLVHQMQRLVMSQAAARAYPHLYRVLGGRVPAGEPQR